MFPLEYAAVSTVAILGAGPIGASVAHRLAARGRVSRIVLVDASASVAAGKALDIRQSGPVEKFDTPIDAAADPLAASGADAIVIADPIADGGWEGERGLALLRDLARAGASGAFVFAGPRQTWLMEAAYRELKVPADRLVGTAPSALASAVQALAGLEIGQSAASVAVVGRPPSFVVGWTAATASGSLLSERVPAHRLLAISQGLKRLWPPGPYAIGAATARVVEALLGGARQLLPALTIIDGELETRGAAVMLPLELGTRRVRAHLIPSLSPQERVELTSGIAIAMKTK